MLFFLYATVYVYYLLLTIKVGTVISSPLPTGKMKVNVKVSKCCRSGQDEREFDPRQPNPMFVNSISKFENRN